MNKLSMATMLALILASISLAPAAFAESGCTDGCLPDDPPEQDDPPEKVKGNNGLGNGDQPAPGNSLDNNKAENQVGNPGHPSGKPQTSD